MDLALLGPVEVRDRGSRVEIGGAKQRVVLAHLVLRANRVVSADRLIDDVWGDDPPAAARKSLHAYISRLRRALGDGARIEGRSPGYALIVDPERIDVERFTSLLDEARRLRVARPEAALDVFAEALGLWRGPALDDLADEPSLQGQIAALDEQRLAALEERIDTELALGRETAALPELEALTREHPLRERFWALLMVALYRTGRQGDALNAYLRARQVLNDELGVEPSSELERLQGQILAQDEELEVDLGHLRGYQLRERIGGGETGVVYRAIQPHFGRDVALKAIHPQRAQLPEFARRFEVEAQEIAGVDHPRIVPVLDYWRGPDGAFVVSRWMRGGSLRATLERRTLNDDEVARVAEQIGGALAAAHRAGVVHGGIRPGNVLFDEGGEAYIADFAVGGSALAQPDRPPPDAITDQADFAAMISTLLQRSRATAELPGPVERVLARATAVDPGARYPDVTAFTSALRLAFGEAAEPPDTLPAAENPFVGLRPFHEIDRARFFGREALVAELLDRLTDTAPGHRFLALVGASGSGKSSAVRAGLVPRLRERGLPGVADCAVVEMYPGESPFEALDEALLRIAVAPPPSFLGTLTAGEGGIGDAANQALPPDGSELVLVIDQFEEFFTLVTDAGMRSRFFAGLARAIADPGSRLRVIATLRADFYDRPLADRAIAGLLRDRTVTIIPLTPGEIAEAVTGPAARTGVEVEPALVAALVADALDQPGALPLLQYALTELHDRQTDGRMTLSAYRSLGGMAGAVAGRADELYRSLDARGQQAARQLFLRLVRLGEGSNDARRRVALTELAAMDVDQAALQAVIDLYGHHRLLSFDRDPRTRHPTVEVAHESLLSAWGRLQHWIDDARDDLRSYRHLADASTEWAAGGRDESHLWRGARLEQAQAWAATGAIALADEQRAFLEASSAAHDREVAAEEERRARELSLERRSVQRLRALAIVLAVAGFLAAGLTGFALTQRDEAARSAREAQARELAGQATLSLTEDPERSILLALEAIRTTRDVDGTVVAEAEAALHEAVNASRLVLSIPSGGGIFFSPDGRTLAVGGARDISVIDVPTGTVLHTLSGHTDAVFNVVFAPSGEILASNANDGTTRVWEIESETLLYTLDQGGDPTSLAISPDGALLARSIPERDLLEIRDLNSGDLIRRIDALGPVGINFSPDGSEIGAATTLGVEVWRLDTGEPALPTLEAQEGLVFDDVAFSPDGQLIAASGDSPPTVWTTDGERVTTAYGHTGTVEGVAFSPDSAVLGTVSTDGTLRLWEARSGRPLMTLSGHSSGVINVDFSADGSWVASADGREARVWDIRPDGGGEWLTIARHPWVIDVSIGPNDRLLATAGFDNRARIFDLDTGEERAVLEGHLDAVRRITFSPDGETVATSSFDGSTRIWDVGSEASTPLWGEETGGAAFSPDGTQLATAQKGWVIVYDVASGAFQFGFPVSDLTVADVAWRSDGAVIATSSFDCTTALWDAATGDLVRRLDGTVHENGAGCAELQVAFSPDGSLVAAASWDGSIHLWDASSGAELTRLEGHKGEVWAVAFSDDGTLLASGGADGTARIWDVASRRQRLVLASHEGIVTAVEFTHDGRRLVTAAEDQLVRVFALELDDLIQLAEERVTRSLTDEECRQYLGLDRCPSQS